MQSPRGSAFLLLNPPGFRNDQMWHVGGAQVLLSNKRFKIWNQLAQTNTIPLFLGSSSHKRRE